MAADVTIFAALFAGLLSFLSPCVLPLVPPYLVYLAGATIEHVATGEAPASSRRAAMLSALPGQAGQVLAQPQMQAPQSNVERPEQQRQP